MKRIASGGTGILNEGELHPDLVNRFAIEAVKTANQVLTICIRALDYCPPVDITFGDYLRALITADRDVVINDTRAYRLAFIDAFRQHGIFPGKLRSLSEESLTWDRAEAIADYYLLSRLGEVLKPFFSQLRLSNKRYERWETTRKQRLNLHNYLQKKFWDEFKDSQLQEETGLDFGITQRSGDEVKFEVHSMWPVQRQRPDGSVLNQVVFSILQHRPLEEKQGSPEIWGGCTCIVDLDRDDEHTVRYLIRKPLFGQEGENGRISLARKALTDPDTVPLASMYGLAGGDEPFAMLHAGQ